MMSKSTTGFARHYIAEFVFDRLKHRGAWQPADRVEVERNRKMMKSDLNADEFEKATKVGGAMNMDQAIALGLLPPLRHFPILPSSNTGATKIIFEHPAQLVRTRKWTRMTFSLDLCSAFRNPGRVPDS